VDLQDRYVIVTPDGLHLDLVLAGVGSRAAALLIDSAIQFVAFLALAVAALVVARGAGAGYVIAVLAILFFLVEFGYWVLFEVLGSGRSPGKRVVGLRVVQLGGEAPTFRASAARTVLRLVDMLPAFYLVGMVSVLLTQRNQRLGDLVGRTVVVTERPGGAAPGVAPGAGSWASAGAGGGGTAGAGGRGPAGAGGWGTAGAGGWASAGASAWTPGGDGTEAERGPLPPWLRAWDVSGISPDDAALVRSFLTRRATLDPGARAELAWNLARRLGPRVVRPPGALEDEQFLEYLLRAKEARGG